MIVKPTGSGTVTVKYAGKLGWTASTATRALTVNEWISSLTLSATRTPRPATCRDRHVDGQGQGGSQHAQGRLGHRDDLPGDRHHDPDDEHDHQGRRRVLRAGQADGLRAVTAKYNGVAGYAPYTASPVTVNVP